AIISGALTLSMLTFFLQFDQPFIDRWAAGTAVDPRGPYWMEEELGMIGLILYSAAVVGLLVILLRRFELPTGALTVTLSINALPGESARARVAAQTLSRFSAAPDDTSAGSACVGSCCRPRVTRSWKGCLSIRKSTRSCPSISRPTGRARG